MTDFVPATKSYRKNFLVPVPVWVRAVITVGVFFAFGLVTRFDGAISGLIGFLLLIAGFAGVAWTIVGISVRPSSLRAIGKVFTSIGTAVALFIGMTVMVGIGNSVAVGVVPYSQSEIDAQAKRKAESRSSTSEAAPQSTSTSAATQSAKPTTQRLSREQACQIVINNARQVLAVYRLAEEAQSGSTYASQFDWTSWPEGYAVTNAGASSRQSQVTSIQHLFPWIQPAVDDLLGSMSQDQALGQTAGSWKDSDSFQIAKQRQLDTVLLKGTGIAPRPDFTLTYDYTDHYSPDFIHYVVGQSNEGTGDCNLGGWLFGGGVDAVGLIHQVFTAEDLIPSLNQGRAATVTIDVLMCNRFGAGRTDSGVRACAESDFVDSGGSVWEPTTRNPFLEPHGDETLQGLAEFAYCWNQGLEVNSSRTGCDE